MANRILTPEQMAKLCSVVHPDFRVITDNGLVGVLFRYMKMDVTPADMMLSDADFTSKFPRQMLGWWQNSSPDWRRVNRDHALSLHDQRGATHGDYTRMAVTAQNIKIAMQAGTQWGGLTPIKAEALHSIATKLARILCGDSDCKDHWQDIAGYAMLVADRIEIAAKRD